MTAFAETPLGEIATALPGATAVLHRHRLDFCCGGGATLAEAARKRGLDAGAIAAELAALTPGASELPEETEALIALILERFHAGHRRDLPELIRLARKVEAVHRERADVPKGLADLLDETALELEQHMQKEEAVLFPMMQRGGHPMIGMPISMMRHEHDGHGENLERLAALTNDFTPPEDACRTWRALYGGLQHLREELMLHIHAENNILFPQFGS
jgi:regulator of cell morphogenesis and NO signaling